MIGTKVLRSFEIIGQLKDREVCGVFRQREFETMSDTIKRGRAILKYRLHGQRVRWFVTDITVLP